MASVLKVLVLLSSLATFSYTFYVVGKFMLFLSVPRSASKVYTWVFNLLDNRSRLETAYGAIVYDTLYLIGFIFQHSFMKSELVKTTIQKLGLSSAERTIYALTSSLCLHYMLRNWLAAPSIVLWQVDVTESVVLWWTFVITHAICWIVIYGGSIIMDLPELLGIKQAYYDFKQYAHPNAYKSLELRHLYTHVRHPSFVGLTIILFATNIMTLDRFVLSILLTAYMYCAWSTDHSDVVYQKAQLKRKIHELKAQ